MRLALVAVRHLKTFSVRSSSQMVRMVLWASSLNLKGCLEPASTSETIFHWLFGISLISSWQMGAGNKLPSTLVLLAVDIEFSHSTQSVTSMIWATLVNNSGVLECCSLLNCSDVWIHSLPLLYTFGS